MGLFRVHPASEERGCRARVGGEAVGFDIFFAGHFGGGGVDVVVREGIGDDGSGWLWHGGCENWGLYIVYAAAGMGGVDAG